MAALGELALHLVTPAAIRFDKETDFHWFNCSSRGDEAQIAGGKVRASLRRLLHGKDAALVEPALRLVAPAAMRFDEGTD